MENKNLFTYHYSAERNKEVELIRQKYLPKKEDKFETIRKLDNRVQSAGMIPALCIGIIGSLIFGIGLCFGLDVFIGAKWIAVLFGVIGVIIMLPAYPIYKRIARKTKTKLAPEIIRLADELTES